MYNPHFPLFYRMVNIIMNKHIGEMKHLHTEELIVRDDDGDIIQVMPKLHIDFKF